jgi:hypothetical protein
VAHTCNALTRGTEAGLQVQSQSGYRVKCCIEAGRVLSKIFYKFLLFYKSNISSWMFIKIQRKQEWNAEDCDG